VVSSVLVVAGGAERPDRRRLFEETGTAVVVAILVIGRDSRFERAPRFEVAAIVVCSESSCVTER
jgi:hypothetical protein